MFNLVICWRLGGTTRVFDLVNENEVVNMIHQVTYGHAQKFKVFKNDELIATFNEFGNMI